jgi:succinate dehydrogenase / fumarate reductase cytochrome b subunit
VKKQRPVNLDLTTIKMPATAKASILHRITGVAFFFAMVFVIVAWAVSLQSADGFAMAQAWMAGPFGKFVAIGSLAALSYHIIGGIRHLIMDMGHWEELESGNNSAVAAIAIWLVTVVVAGVWLW